MANVMDRHGWLKTLEGEEDLSLDELYELEGYFSDSDPLDVDESKIDPPIPEKNFERIIVVDNVPQVPENKTELLQRMLTKVFSECGTIETGILSKDDTGIYLPMTEDGKLTAGFAFIHFRSPHGAMTAVRQKNNYKLDTKHTFLVNLYSDLLKFQDWPEEFVPPIPEPWQEELEKKAVEDKYSHLLDDAVRDQFLIRQGDETEVYWYEGLNMKGDATLAYAGEEMKKKGQVWTKSLAGWTPKGTYLVTYHNQGICLWSGKSFERAQRFSHGGMIEVLFSNDEKRAITWNGSNSDSDARALILWDVESGKEIRAFKGSAEPWPMITFSYSGKYFARKVENGISVYDAATAKQLEKKPIKTKGVVQFKWSKGQDLLAYWAPEEGDQPASVVILDPKTRSFVKRKNLFNVKDVTLHWENNGNFLCAEVTRQKKKSKTTFSVLEIFRMRDSNIPNETMEFKENVQHFSFEPKGHRFGVVLNNSQTGATEMKFYSAQAIVGGTKIEEFHSMGCSGGRQIVWSPAGTTALLHGFDRNEANIQFFNADKCEVTSEGEHFTARFAIWDPSGRTIATVAAQHLYGENQMRDKLENGYFMWSFQGTLLAKKSFDSLYQLVWRPVPEDIEDEPILDEKVKAEVEKDIKSFIKRFKEEDEKRRKRLELAENVEKLRMLKSFRALMAEKVEKGNKITVERISLGYEKSASSEDYQVIQDETEELISEKVEII